MAELTRAQATTAAVAIVDNFAPEAPASVRSAAASMVEQSLLDTPYDGVTAFDDQRVETHNMGASIVRRCGASSILAPWRRPRARPIAEAAT